MALWGKQDQAGDKPKFAAGADTYGVDAVEAGLKPVTHAGWVKLTKGTGPVVSVQITSGGTGYTNNASISFTGGGGTGAAGTIITTGGVITGINLTSGGSGYTSAPTASVTGGTGGVLSAAVGGRAGRKHYETLVAMGSITGDDADDAEFPDA